MVEFSPELAEICGIHAGDGYLRDDGQRRELDISGNVEEEDYYKNHVFLLFQKVFNVKINPKLFPSRNTFGFVLRDRNIIKFIHSLGFPYGNKTLIVKAPSFVIDNNNHQLYVSFLRGLFDTDGHVSCRKFYGKYSLFKRKKHHYPSIQFKVVSKPLIEDIIKILRLLDFDYNLYSHKPKENNSNISYQITINGGDQVTRWMKEIGSKNSSKLSRYLVWKKF